MRAQARRGELGNLISDVCGSLIVGAVSGKMGVRAAHAQTRIARRWFAAIGNFFVCHLCISHPCSAALSINDRIAALGFTPIEPASRASFARCSGVIRTPHQYDFVRLVRMPSGRPVRLFMVISPLGKQKKRHTDRYR